MENGHTGRYILGDNGYSCINWLMTPLLQPNNEAEQRYNSTRPSQQTMYFCGIHDSCPADICHAHSWPMTFRPTTFRT